MHGFSLRVGAVVARSRRLQGGAGYEPLQDGQGIMVRCQPHKTEGGGGVKSDFCTQSRSNVALQTLKSFLDKSIIDLNEC